MLKEKFIHPEIKNGEEFIMNVTSDEFDEWKMTHQVKTSPFKSLRLGTTAYVTNGSQIVKDLMPMFGIVKPKYKPRKKVMDI